MARRRERALFPRYRLSHAGNCLGLLPDSASTAQLELFEILGGFIVRNLCDALGSERCDLGHAGPRWPEAGGWRSLGIFAFHDNTVRIGAMDGRSFFQTRQ